MSNVQQYRIRTLSYLVGVEVHPAEDRVEIAVFISLALNFPCAITKYGINSSGGRRTRILDVVLLPSQGDRVYQYAHMIDVRHTVLIEVVVEVHAVVKRRHNVERSEGSRFVVRGELQRTQYKQR